MNKIFSLMAALLTCLCLLPACSKDDPFPYDQLEKGMGQASFKKMMVEVSNAERVVRAEGVDVGTFLVEVASTTGKMEYSGTYADMPEVLTLPVASYTVKVKSPSNPDAAWETPYYEGEQTFTVVENDVTFVDPVVCKLANIKVTVRYDAKLLAQMSDDCNVTVKAGETGQLVYAKTETRDGFFRYVADATGTPTLVATFQGTVEGNNEENLRTYTDLAPGNHYVITYTLHTPGEDVPDQTGTISIANGIYVDATVTVENMTVNINPDEDYLDDDMRPSTGDAVNPNPDPDPDPNPPTPTPTGDKAQISATIGSADVNFDNSYPVTDDPVKVKVVSTADGGLTGFIIDINSTTLTDEILSGVGLGSHLDLINPGSLSTGLQSLGFPVEGDVQGKSSVEFDISQFVPLLKIYGAGDHRFQISVTDANGTISKTLHFVTE